MSWIIGILGVLLNSIVIVKTIYILKKCRTTVAYLTNSLIILINFGDFLVGVYLLLVAILDSFYSLIYGGTYCSSQLRWLTSMECSCLGVISTTGSQISLFAMTLLSLERYRGIGVLKIHADATYKTVAKTTLIAVLIISAAVIGPYAIRGSS